MDVRIQKFLSEQGIASRRTVELWIDEGRIEVNGEIAQKGQKMTPGKDVIRVDGRTIRPKAMENVTLAMNKPRGVICSHGDPHHSKTIYDLLPQEQLKHKFNCAGRLDKDSEGLLVLTTDGELMNTLTHPSNGVVKRYLVDLSRPLDPKLIPKLLRGVKDEGELLQAKKVFAVKSSTRGRNRYEVHLTQGRKREIRRMFEKFGYFVNRLKRYQMGRYIMKRITRGEIKVLGKKDIELLTKI